MTNRKAPDNNKRLALLEGGVSALAIALTANGFTLAEGVDPIEAAIGAIKGQAAKIDEAGTLLDLNKAVIDAAEKRILALESTSAEEANDGALAALKDQLAAAEQRVAELAAAIVEHKQCDDPAEGVADPIAHAVLIVEKYAHLGAQVAELADYLLAHHPSAIDGSAGACGTAVKVLEQLTVELGELEQDLKDQAEAHAKAAADVPDVPRDVILERLGIARDRPSTARDLGPTFGSIETAELGKLIEEGEEFELAFSNGEFEIVDFNPQPIKAADLRGKSGRFELAHPIYVSAAEHAEQIHGAALIHGGEQISYCEFPSPVGIEPRAQRRFERAIAFG